MSFANRDMNAWRGCRWRNCTGCGRAASTGSAALLIKPPRPTQVAIGERRWPDPQGRPGYLRVDTVHQGDQEGVKGLYHINAVDEVTQWEVVGATAQISEAWLMPVLEAMLAQFPFPNSRLSFRQRQRIYQLQRSGFAQQAIGGADQVAAAPQQRQRTGGDEKRMGNSQAHRLRPYHARRMRKPSTSSIASILIRI